LIRHQLDLFVSAERMGRSVRYLTPNFIEIDWKLHPTAGDWYLVTEFKTDALKIEEFLIYPSKLKADAALEKEGGPL
jgi:hypothetical protein